MSSSLQLSSETPIGKEEARRLSALVTHLWNEEESAEFRNAVNYKELGLADYPEIIKNPQDLGQVRRHLKNNKYVRVEECLDDLQTIWDNCKLYNSETSWIFDLALKMENTQLQQMGIHFPLIDSMKEANVMHELEEDRLSFE